MSDEISEIIEIKNDLTPESAKGLGLKWVKDAIYDKEAPLETMKDILDLIKMGFVLGKCATTDGESNNLVGVYKKAGI